MSTKCQVLSIQSFVHDSLTTIGIEVTCLQDFLIDLQVIEIITFYEK